jgi:hypothetical protein
MFSEPYLHWAIFLKHQEMQITPGPIFTEADESSF